MTEDERAIMFRIGAAHASEANRAAHYQRMIDAQQAAAQRLVEAKAARIAADAALGPGPLKASTSAPGIASTLATVSTSRR